MGSAFIHGWVSLPTQGEIYLEHGMPCQVRIDSKVIADEELLLDEIADVTGLHVSLDKWETEEEGREKTAVVHVISEDSAEMQKHRARVSGNPFRRYFPA